MCSNLTGNKKKCFSHQKYKIVEQLSQCHSAGGMLAAFKMEFNDKELPGMKDTQ